MVSGGAGPCAPAPPSPPGKRLPWRRFLPCRRRGAVAPPWSCLSGWNPRPSRRAFVPVQSRGTSPRSGRSQRSSSPSWTFRFPDNSPCSSIQPVPSTRRGSSAWQASRRCGRRRLPTPRLASATIASFSSTTRPFGGLPGAPGSVSWPTNSPTRHSTSYPGDVVGGRSSGFVRAWRIGSDSWCSSGSGRIRFAVSASARYAPSRGPCPPCGTIRPICSFWVVPRGGWHGLSAGATDSPTGSPSC